MGSEKVKEIKKGLECCINPELNCCSDCPYNINGKLSCLESNMLKDVLTLINELESENERLKTQLAQANAGIVNCSGCKLVEINAVREFVEKLKECAKSCEESGYDGIGEDDIDLILKEYEEL